MRQRIICWFSCGIASAIATKMILDENHEDKEVLIVYTDTGAEHEDNKRFLRECEQWYKKKITTLKTDNEKKTQKK